jgi:tetratricopeptide (TPR) repeat protein
MQNIEPLDKIIRLSVKRIICRLSGRNNDYFYLHNFICMLGIMFLCISCAVSSVESPSQKKVLTGYNKPQQEREVEANDDMACSYFYFLWGKTAENSARFEEANEAYEKALLCDPESRFLKQSLAILLIKMDHKAQAAGVLEEIISSDPEDRENRMLLAKVYRSMGQLDKAVAIYQELLKVKEDHDTLLMLGTLYAQKKEYDKAQKILKRLIELEGDSYLAYYSLARLYRELQYYDQAGAAYEKALELNWFERLAYEVAEFYEKQHEFDKAIGVYNRIIEEDQASDLAKTRLVNLYLTLGENDRALKLLRDLRLVMPESHNVDITISRILLSQEKYDEAIMILEDVLQTNPELTIVRYMIGMAYYRNNNFLKAEENLEAIPPESNLYEDAVFLRLKILGENDSQGAAIELLEQQISDAATRKPSFYILLASLYRENEKVEKARETYEQGFRLYPDDIDLLYNYGIFFEKIGKQDEAMDKMQAVLAKDPGNGAALNYVGYTWADNNINLERALEYITKAVEILPEDGYVRDSLGWVYYKLGNVEQAVIELEKASEMVADDPIIKEHLGDVYLHNKQFEKALSVYERAYQLFVEDEKKEELKQKINSIKSRSGM